MWLGHRGSAHGLAMGEDVWPSLTFFFLQSCGNFFLSSLFTRLFRAYQTITHSQNALSTSSMLKKCIHSQTILVYFSESISVTHGSSETSIPLTPGWMLEVVTVPLVVFKELWVRIHSPLSVCVALCGRQHQLDPPSEKKSRAV